MHYVSILENKPQMSLIIIVATFTRLVVEVTNLNTAIMYDIY